MNLFDLGGYWELSRDGDPRGLEIFKWHYSYRKTRTNQKLFVGPGEKMVLIGIDGQSLFVWRKFINDSGQDGVNCAIFRNESNERSSLMILEAEQIARNRWPQDRFYTYVDASKIRSVNPGACFKAAGWRTCGITQKRKYIILEKKLSFSDHKTRNVL